jgi:hypothetical protein
MYYHYMYSVILRRAFATFFRLPILGGFVFVAILHQAGMMGFYEKFWWYDVMMHGLGGLWTGLFFLVWHKIHPFLPSDAPRQIIRLLGIVLLVGFLWEVLEAGFDYTIGMQLGFGQLWGDPRQGALLDSAEDLLMDIAGGLGAYLIIKNTTSKTI